ncbi:MAG TPA: molybdate ABC transporter substrate-binding protein [Pseudogracilibacillus sp.]|nr:molybdate ABC transporter substrate-binding protein [Pseudogracilibacillus sp.]
MKKIIVVSLFFIVSLSMSGCNEEKTELQVAAAASLTDAMKEIKTVYEKEHDVDLSFNFAGSGKLAQQIQQGAPVDVFVSANEDWMDRLEQESLIETDTKEDVVGNELVLIAKKGSNFNYSSMEDIDKTELDDIAIGMPESVPAGAYTKQTLQATEQWDDLEDLFIYAKDVRQVLTYVESGNADVGFVYESDAETSDQVEVLATADSVNIDSIVYPGGVTASSTNKSEAEAFLTFLQTEEVQDVLDKYGFVSR